MNKQGLNQMWDLVRQRHGIAVRLIGALPADQLDSTPIPNMRTPKELVVHLYDVVVKGMAEGVVRGEVIVEGNEKPLAASLKSKEDLLAFVKKNWDAANRAVASITDAQLAADVKTPWGMSFPGWQVFGITNDEFLHHRGQLYAYSRALGVAPPMMWDFGNNDPEFRPKAQAHA